jgi:hypothetical protein
MLAIYVLDRNQHWLEIQKGGSISAGSACFLLILIVLILMMTFYLRFGREHNASSTALCLWSGLRVNISRLMIA